MFHPQFIGRSVYPGIKKLAKGIHVYTRAIRVSLGKLLINLLLDLSGLTD